MLQPILFEDRIALLLFTRQGLHYASVEVERSSVERTIGRITAIMRQRNIDDLDQVTRRSQRLHEWLIAPLAEQLEGVDHLVVCAAGAFRYLPLQLLHDGESWLVERYRLSSITNVGALRGGGRGWSLGSDAVIGLANPDGSLPSATEETRQIASIFDGGSYYYGDEATLAHLEESAHGKTVLHLATHGILDPDEPDASYIMGGALRPGRPPLLPGHPRPAPRARRRRPGRALACETARAVGNAEELGRGVEISGIANQFRRAGIPSLIASLWQVSDEATGKLMISFYQSLSQGTAPAEALRQAQLALLAEEGFEHPFYWSAFILIGAYD